jgi:hypothetical protein
MVEEGKLAKSTIASRLKIPVSTLFTWLNQSDKIKVRMSSFSKKFFNPMNFPIRHTMLDTTKTVTEPFG